jgi:cytochrome c-type biogenesis protein CcmH/NrfG
VFELVVFAVAVVVGGALAARPLLGAPATWPVDPPGERDDVARAVSSLRDLEFARAAGTIDAADHARLRAALEREALAPRDAARPRPAPVATLAVAAALAAIAAVAVVASLPYEAGDRAPGAPLTGTVPQRAPGSAELEARAARSPSDIPTLLALADAYRGEGRADDAARTYQRVLGLDRENVAALNGLALLLYQSGERAGAMLAVDRVLALRPRDADALFLKGLERYQAQDWRGAVEAWRVYLDVGEFHPAAGMVRPLYEEARRKSGS